MSSKTNQQQGRRTPLSLSSGSSSGGLSGSAGTQRNVKASPTSNGKHEPKIILSKIDKQGGIAAASAANAQIEVKKSTNNENKIEKVENAKKDQQNGNHSNKASNGKSDDSNGHSVKIKKIDKIENIDKKLKNDDNRNIEKVDKTTENKTEKDLKTNKSEVNKEKLMEKKADKEQKINKTESIKTTQQQQQQQQPQDAPKVTEKLNVEKESKTKSPTTKQQNKISKEEFIEKVLVQATEKITTKKTSVAAVLTTTDVTPKKKNNEIIEEFEMDTLTVDPSPIKASLKLSLDPTATSTPDKIKPTTSKHLKSEVELAMQTGDITPARNYTQIAGRRSIRPLTDFTPSKLSNNLPYRESYRRINTELDATTVSNTSMNVTVGSEVPNNSSFSFFGRRKRDRSSPNTASTQELATDVEMHSPPKRARIDGGGGGGILSVLATPITLIRSKFSRASLKTRSPINLESQLNEIDIVEEVQNVSGVSIEEEIEKTNVEITPADELSIVVEDKDQIEIEKSKIAAANTNTGDSNINAEIQVIETEIDAHASSTSKRCVVM